MTRQKRGPIGEELVELYKTNNIPAIARMSGLHNSVITRRLQELGVEMRCRGVNGCTKPEERKMKHGYAKRALELGISASRYVRILAVKKMGAVCRCCGNTDLRVLQINHINGEGVERYENGRRKATPAMNECIKIIEGDDLPDHLEVLCANCNIVHEYERGNVLPIPEEIE